MFWALLRHTGRVFNPETRRPFATYLSRGNHSATWCAAQAALLDHLHLPEISPVTAFDERNAGAGLGRTDLIRNGLRILRCRLGHSARLSSAMQIAFNEIGASRQSFTDPNWRDAITYD